MKRLSLLMVLLVFAVYGCDSGSSSSGGGGGLNMDGNWAGQWGASVKTSSDTAIPVGGNIRASLKLNGKQLAGPVWVDGASGHFSATLSNPNGPGNIEAGSCIIYSKLLGPEVIPVSFHGTYNSNQIYAQLGPSVKQTGNEGLVGNFTLTK